MLPAQWNQCVDRKHPKTLIIAQNCLIPLVYKEEQLFRPFERITITISTNNTIQPINSLSQPLYKNTLL